MTLRISRMSLITRDCMCEGERERENGHGEPLNPS